MASFAIPDDSRPALRSELSRAIIEGAESFPFRDEPVPIGDLARDFRRFMDQARFYLAHGLEWPCVCLQRVDIRNGEPVPRMVPLDIEGLEVGPRQDAWQAYVGEAASIVRLYRRTVDEASRGFFESTLDTTLGRSQSFRLFGQSSKPNVEVKTTPPGEDVMYCLGHFFSTRRMFGRTDCSQAIPAGSYCFYRRSETPHTAMPLWKITGNRIIRL